MAKYIAIFNDNLAGVELNGFQLMTLKEVDDFEELATSISWEFSYGVGDNDKLYYSNGEDLLTRIEFKEITNEEYKMVKNIFNVSFGVFIGEDFLNILIDDNEDESDENEDGYINDEDDDY